MMSPLELVSDNKEHGLHPPEAADSIMPLRVENLAYSVNGQALLKDVSFSIKANTRTMILGPNGAGKSLLLRLCHGLLKPSSGSIRWAVNDARTVKRAQAMVFQRPVLLRRSVAANMSYALALRGVSWRGRKEMITRALDQIGLAHLADRPARVLSGGEQQRLALARAWVLRPQVLFLDEPTANLDPGATRRIEEIVNTIHQNGTAIVMTTHDLGQARRNADNVMFLHQGCLLEHTGAATFFSNAQSVPARAFIAGELLG